MSTDHRKLAVFGLADELTLRVYGATREFAPAERFGLRAQIRRSAVSIPTNIVEGCARDSDREHDRFYEIAFASCRELIYLVELAGRLGAMDQKAAADLALFAGRVAAALAALRKSLKR